MTKIDLITGFLGSGKTTFLKRYVNHLLSLGERVCILEFDYGAINVDMMLLQEFDNRCDLEMVAGGCDYDCHLRRFKTKLIAMGMKHYDRVIVEPSGIFDTDEFFDTLYEDPLDQWYEIGSLITIVDSGLSDNLSEESQYILMSQLANAGLVVMSKTQLHTSEEIDHVIDYVSSVMKKYNIALNPDHLLKKDFASFTQEDYHRFMTCGYHTQDHVKLDVIESNKYDSVYLLNPGLTLTQLSSLAEVLFSKPETYGQIMRIKGFVQEENSWYEFNMTKGELEKNPITQGQDVVIVIGENLKDSPIKDLFKK